jgi:bifunctional N-acetylglucosamine-1-phosphate-uridyltransferase/glucosamine-1-phosphate-acetyltransferase GlmU-like protein
MLKPEDFFDLTEFEHRQLFDNQEYVWEALKKIRGYIREAIRCQRCYLPNLAEVRKNGDVLSRTYVLYQGQVLDSGFELEPGDVTKGKFRVYQNGAELSGATVLYAGSALFGEEIYIGQGSVVEPGALIKGPTIIGNYTEVRQGAYIRGDCLVGNRCVVGHTTEIKNGVMLNEAKAGHFAYVGDSILGNGVNLGAGTKLANLKIVESSIILRINRQRCDTGLKKFGAIIGDQVATGCNSVTNPGTLLGQGSLVYPNTAVKSGYYPPQTIIKAS